MIINADYINAMIHSGVSEDDILNDLSSIVMKERKAYIRGCVPYDQLPNIAIIIIEDALKNDIQYQNFRDYSRMFYHFNLYDWETTSTLPLLFAAGIIKLYNNDNSTSNERVNDLMRFMDIQQVIRYSKKILYAMNEFSNDVDSVFHHVQDEKFRYYINLIFTDYESVDDVPHGYRRTYLKTKLLID